jgi:O-antigen/teichoic acid export membrane protein
MPSSTAVISVQLKKHRRLLEWFQLLARYSFVQAIAQGLGVIAGIIVVRTLPKEAYGCFVIVNTIGPVMDMLSDNGITGSLSAIGGKFWQDDARMGSLVRTGMTLRKQLVFFSALVVLPVLAWMLMRNHAGGLMIGALIAIVMVNAFFQLNVGLLNVVVTLRQQVGRMQALVISGTLPRLVLIALFAGLGILNAPLAVTAAATAFGIQYFLLRHWVRPQIVWCAPPSETFRGQILAIVKKQAPLTIYFCLQGQIGIWLISIFGNVHRVAEVGALGRIGMIFAIVVSTTSSLIVPRFARCQDPVRLRYLYAIIILSFTGIVALGSCFAWLFPSPLLGLLGAQYSQLGGLVWLAVLASGISALASVLYTLNVNRGWIPSALVAVPLEIAGQLVLCLSFDLSSVRDILLIGILGPLVPSAISIILALRKMKSTPQPVAM